MTQDEGQDGPAQVRLSVRLAVGAALAGAVTTPFLGLLLLVEGRNEQLEALDLRIAGGLNSGALQHPSVVRVLLLLQDALNPNTFRVLVLIAAIVLWRSGARRVALWAAVTTAAGALLGVVLKQLVHRARPSFPDPVAVA